MQATNPLLSILQGCLHPSTVQQSQKQLVQYSTQSNFIPELLQLIPNQPNQIVIMILSTVKNFIVEYYTHPVTPIPHAQKEVLRGNIFSLYYAISEVPQAVNLYMEIVYNVVAADFDKYSGVFYGLLKEDLEGGIAASVYFCRQVARFYEYLNDQDRGPFEKFVTDLFPALESLVEKILSDYNNMTRKLLQQLLQMFYSAFHVEIPTYLRNFQNMDKWILYLSTVLKAPLDDYPQNHIEVSRIYAKLFANCCRDGNDRKSYKGWSAQFRQKYAVSLYTQTVQILINPVANQQVMSNILNCLCSVTNNPDLNPLMEQSHCQAIIYKHLLPFMESTAEDYSYFKNDSLQYIRRCEDLTCHPFRRVSLDLIKSITGKFNFGGKSELMKFIEYAAVVLGDDAYTPKQKEVIIIVLTELQVLVMKNEYLRNNFENLTVQYFIPLLKCNNEVVISQVLKLLAEYLRKASLSTATVTELMALLYDKMCGNNLVVKYHAILAFTSLLDDKQALETAKPHFQNILTIYVKLLEVIDHQALISSLESIVKIFSNEIVTVAPQLSDHLFNLFYSLHNKQTEENGDDDEQNMGRQATAALSTIRQILEAPLSHQVYYQISEKAMILVKDLCSDYDAYFQDILNILNTLVYKTSNIVNFEFPYLLCRKLLEGDNQVLANCDNGQFVSIISEAAKADTQYSETLISILKNLIQKMPPGLLLKYPYPSNPELLLCLLQNKRVPAEQLQSLPRHQLDRQWELILQSYSAVIYNLGEVCQPAELKMMNGISLYPWIEYKLDIEVIRKLLLNLEDEQADDQYYQENTVQMLEQYANEDEDDAEYYVSSGGNYGYMYDSPYDSSRDQAHLAAKLKMLPQGQFEYIFGQLSTKQATKLKEILQQ